MYFDRLFFNDPSRKKKLRTGCFCKILGTISNAIDVWSSFSCMSLCFRVRFLSLESDLQTESESVLWFLFLMVQRLFNFFSLSPCVKEAREGCWFSCSL